MIDPKELRIGNLVGFYKPLLKDLQVGSIEEIHLLEDGYHLGVNDFSKYTLINLAGLSGIPLTEEWLLRLGFGKDGEAPGRLKLDCDLGVITIRPGKNVEYVHQLQNIYFTLAGLELTIKTPEHAT